MHGLIFVELKSFVVGKYGPEAWNAILDKAGLAGRAYLPNVVYPDADAIAIVTAASAATGLPANAILEAFGEFIAPHLIALYRAQLHPAWRTLDVLEHTEETIHRLVRLRDPGAAPPRLTARRTSPSEVVIAYESARRMCAVAIGIARGIATSFGERVDVTEPACMIKGDPRCEIIISLRS